MIAAIADRIICHESARNLLLATRVVLQSNAAHMLIRLDTPRKHTLTSLTSNRCQDVDTPLMLVTTA